MINIPVEINKQDVSEKLLESVILEMLLQNGLVNPSTYVKAKEVIEDE